MNQAVLEGIPSGRDPWSVAKVIPGVQVSTYDVGGTQSFQQSSLSAHGSSTNDVSYNIDGASVNWPGGGGGATMIYYDQGMFEEVNYMTSAIPAEVMTGGVSINMVTKDAGNKWRGDLRYNYGTGCLTPTNPKPGCLESDNSASAIAKNPNLGSYKILQSPSVAIPSSMAVRREQDKRWRDFLSVWVDYNRGIGQMREWFVKGLTLAGVKPEDVPVELNI